jgi:hypothetical protein
LKYHLCHGGKPAFPDSPETAPKAFETGERRLDSMAFAMEND